ncbi:CPBP family intramembrane glutamic endopeptidase [Edaphocola flava]|uniref:CPBP family intramembrane glutamic endopeptidase n=1 Tax=Edaphocola flava TaxID=2499629 RepID=UPI001386699A|nr:CPBP family intramembrane glutamic endopeptidase [Edaphocola flava]
MLANAVYTHTISELFANYTNLLKSILPHFNQWLTTVFAAGMEEILFRFIILSLLIYNGVNRYLAMLFSSVLFAMVHLQYNLYVLGHIVQIGTALSMLYLIFRNLGVAIGMHAAHNYIIDADHSFQETNYTPHSFMEVLQDNVTVSIVCCLVILLWIYTQYIRPRLQKQQISL